MNEVTPKTVAMEDATVTFSLSDGCVHTAVAKVRMASEFHSLHHEIWSVLMEEVLKGYAQSGTA